MPFGQVFSVGPHTAPHGKKERAWIEVAANLSQVAPFSLSGGIKWDSARKMYNSLLVHHRREIRSGEFTSGRRDGVDDMLHRLLNDCLNDEDEAREQKDAQSQAEAQRQQRQDERAQMVSRAVIRIPGVTRVLIYSAIR